MLQPSWLNLVLSDDKLTVTVSTVDALKNVGVDYQTSFPYSFTLVGGPAELILLNLVEL